VDESLPGPIRFTERAVPLEAFDAAIIASHKSYHGIAPITVEAVLSQRKQFIRTGVEFFTVDQNLKPAS